MFKWANIVLLVTSTFLIRFRHAYHFGCYQMNYGFYILIFGTLPHTFLAFSTFSQLLAHFIILSQFLAYFLNS